ncbi:MAG: 30S ribosomal protein S11 [Candidatus Pacebacteria bacterium]|nr:30S ribosomal protein S11 [Candidatus Paceibacterota bacterium]MDD3808215.1 30S ribosomal protein S11 [Candidatus Paceibacterota bacterium]
MGKIRIISKVSSTDEADKINSTIKQAEGKESKLLKQAKKGIIFINSSFNNTIIQAADEKGNVIATTSSGAIGFKGTKKSTPYAASKVAEALIEKIKKNLPLDIEVRMKGIGRGRETALRTLVNIGGQVGLNIYRVLDVTPIPHNGVRPPKARRV